MSGDSVTIPHGGGEAEDTSLANDGFFPDLSTNDFREVGRVDTTISDERVKNTLISAIITVNRELAPFKLKNDEYDTLADVPSDMVGGISILSHMYKVAVFNHAKADLTEQFRDFDSTNSGHDEADKLEATTDDYRRISRENIRAILGKPRAKIVLV